MSFRSFGVRAACAFFAISSAVFAQAQTGPQAGTGLDLGAIDKAADPCKDFYQYACGTWMKKNPIPPDESRWGRFNELNQRNQEILRGILEDSAKNQSRSPLDQKIGGFYASCMDEPEIERRGVDPLKPELERIAHIDDSRALLDEIVRLQQRRIPVFFTFTSSPDPKDAKNTIAVLDQGGLGLPEKAYYFRTDPKSVEIRQKYVATIATMFKLSGVAQPEAEKKATAVMAIETALAKGSLDVTSRRDPQKLFHPVQKSGLEELSPKLKFNEFFEGMKAPQFSQLNVMVPDFIKGLNQVLTAESIGNLRDYLAWHYIDSSANLLPKDFVEADFAFYDQTLLGAKELRPRWKRCVSATDRQLGEALGRKYVEKTFGEEGKARTLRMVGEIEHEMALDLASLPWMSAQTKQQAMVKLHAVANKIGFPEKWRDYSSVNVDPADYFGNAYRAREYDKRRDVVKIGKPTDKTEWFMTPPTVNAYYDPEQNNINFPAGILQPPFYSNKASDAVNYGAIGTVVGHELTHGFDDEGRQYDASGNLEEWWQKKDEEQFNKLADCTVNEYGGFSPVPGVELNGRLTLGENTADNGGIRLSYMALMDDLAKRSIPPSQKVDGYTEAQQFFLGFAQVWCENTRPEAARFAAQTNPHAPGRFRTNGVVKNLPEFSQAFSCKARDAMYVAKGQGCRVW